MRIVYNIEKSLHVFNSKEESIIFIIIIYSIIYIYYYIL